jgi:Arc/MetJ family transcription regulator
VAFSAIKKAMKTVKIATRRLVKWLLDDENALNAALNYAIQ